MNRRSFRLFAICMSCFVLLSSCVVAEKITFKDEISKKASISGKSHVDLSVDDFFVSIVEDLSNWDETASDDAIIDVAIKDFTANLERSSASGDISFIETGHNTYLGDFTFTDFSRLVEDLSNGQKDQSLVTLSEKDGKTHVEFDINMDNYDQLTKVIPFLADPNFEVYGPMYNNHLSEEEYLEMVSFILGEECPESIGKSSIRIQVVAPKAITDHNGKLKNSKTVEFSFPLIQFLLLHEDIHFYLEY